MKKFLAVSLLGVLVLGCGYSTRTLLNTDFRTIHVEPVKNNIPFTTETDRNQYVPLLEVKIRNAVADRFLFDGNLKVVNNPDSDLVIKMSLIDYERAPLRYTDNNDILEYRIQIIISLELWNPATNEMVWSEPRFVGETTYFPTGSQAKSESAALEYALTDLARRVVSRTVEAW